MEYYSSNIVHHLLRFGDCKCCQKGNTSFAWVNYLRKPFWFFFFYHVTQLNLQCSFYFEVCNCEFINQSKKVHVRLISALPGTDRNPDFSSCRELISSSTKAVDELVTGLSKKEAEGLSLQLPCLQTVISARDELHLALRSLSSFWSQQGVDDSRCSAGSDNSSENDSSTKDRVNTHSTVRNKVVSKIVYIAPGVPRSGSPHWV